MNIMKLVTPKGAAKHEFMLNKSSRLAPALVVTIFTNIEDMISVTLCSAAQVGLRCVGLLKSHLRRVTKFALIHNNCYYDDGHT